MAATGRDAPNRTPKEMEYQILEWVREGTSIRRIQEMSREAGGPSARQTIYDILARYGIDTGGEKRANVRFERIKKDSAALARMAMRHANGTVDKETLVAAIGDWELKWKE